MRFGGSTAATLVALVTGVSFYCRHTSFGGELSSSSTSGSSDQKEDLHHHRRQLSLLEKISSHLLELDDPKSVEVRSAEPFTDMESTNKVDWASPIETHHYSDRLCIAYANDGAVTTASVIREDGNLVNLGLPNDYVARFRVECTFTSPTTGNTFLRTSAKLVHHQLSPNFSNCNPKYFQPGYYVEKAKTWHDSCTGRKTIMNGHEGELIVEDGHWKYHRLQRFRQVQNEEVLSSSYCPIVAKKNVVWVSIVGDSVTRQFFTDGLSEAGINSYVENANEWTTGRNVYPSFFLIKRGDEFHHIWFSYTFEFVANNTSLEEEWGTPLTWGHFKQSRGEGQRADDPAWEDSRVPDVVIYSPGYHSVKITPSDFGQAVENIVRGWKYAWERNNLPIPIIHLSLNMAPAPWMIPEKYAHDLPYRTVLNEYRRNLAIIEAARRLDFVTGVIDFFSIELPFNGSPDEESAHKDAVHIGDARVLKIGGDLILQKVCNSV